ncbi:hypothetical protein AOZ07_03040 [Glutamicibacter halophytocola]|uniref:VG15 protein n=1 Tax=Glutamicibacter halophytocola TaxID=1933880 RepID=UPI0006D4BE65|nr:EndoU domain-containing protein [Glutamicibacter halophytocola]ALG28074.1 hypothetical protein AOZ07_03040 [Glutamicibacter halophytocola]
MKRADVDKYRAALDKISDSAKKDLSDAYALMSDWPIDQKREALGDVFVELCRRYGNLSGTVAAEFYDLLREQSSATADYRATLAPNVPDEQARNAYEYSAQQFESDNPAKVVASLNGRLQRFVEYTARETVHVNASKDTARTFWARVPAGGKTCAWCHMLASRGWVYATEQTAGGVGNEFHNDDRCMIIPSFDDSPALAGYDPDALEEKYNKARDEVLSDGLQPDDKTIAGRMREMFPDDFTDGKPQLKPTEKAWNHILHGDEQGGGHLFSSGKLGKNLFPKNWGKPQIDHAIFTTLRRGKKSAPDDALELAEGIYQDILIRVVVKEGAIHSAYPMRGAEIFKLTESGLKPEKLRNIDRSRYPRTYE